MRRIARIGAGMLLAGTLLTPPRAVAGPSSDHPLEVMVEDAAAPWSRADGTGYANDVVVAAFEAAGVPVTLRVVPYARCKRSVLDGGVPACFSMTWAPEFQGLVELDEDALIVLNADVFENVSHPLPRPPAGRCALPRGTSAGTVLDYEYPPEVTALGASGTAFDPVNTDYVSLQRLAIGRVDAAVVVTNDLEARDQKAIDAGVASKVRLAFNCGHETGTIGFSLKHPQGPRAHRQYDRGLRLIRESGVLQRIARHWKQVLAGGDGQRPR